VSDELPKLPIEVVMQSIAQGLDMIVEGRKFVLIVFEKRDHSDFNYVSNAPEDMLEMLRAFVARKTN
jgi:phosphatidate phosphatase APP1